MKEPLGGRPGSVPTCLHLGWREAADDIRSQRIYLPLAVGTGLNCKQSTPVFQGEPPESRGLLCFSLFCNSGKKSPTQNVAWGSWLLNLCHWTVCESRGSVWNCHFWYQFPRSVAVCKYAVLSRQYALRGHETWSILSRMSVGCALMSDYGAPALPPQPAVCRWP